ncbi:MAG: hypothetical protein ACKOF3_04295 [Spartobacteria bacterium]
MKTRGADEVRGRAVRAGWLRYAPQAPALAASSVRLRRNVTKPHAEHLSRSGRPLRDDSEPVANTIRFSMAVLNWRPVRRSALR